MPNEINSRKPTGAVPSPLVLLEGEEKSGKSWAIAVLSASKKIGQLYWLDMGEGAADEYGAVKGANYEVVVHDGEWRTIISQVKAVHAEATKVHEAGGKPVVLAIDSMTAEWDSLKDWLSERARDRKANKERLAKDPTAEVVITNDLWNDAAARHKKLMTLLLTFPGIVIITARGKETVEIKDGKPVEGSKVWKVEGQKNLAFDSSVWIRTFRDKPPLLIGARSVHAGRVPGKDDPVPMPDFQLERVIFDVLKYAGGAPRDLQELTGGEPDDAFRDLLDDITLAEDNDDLTGLWKRAAGMNLEEAQTEHFKTAWRGRRDELAQNQAPPAADTASVACTVCAAADGEEHDETVHAAHDAQSKAG